MLSCTALHGVSWQLLVHSQYFQRIAIPHSCSYQFCQEMAVFSFLHSCTACHLLLSDHDKSFFSRCKPGFSVHGICRNFFKGIVADLHPVTLIFFANILQFADFFCVEVVHKMCIPLVCYSSKSKRGMILIKALCSRAYF